MTPGNISKRVVVTKIISGRYQPGSRPVSWDERREGFETVITAEGIEIELFSSGGQSTPGPNWELMLGNSVQREGGKSAFQWTLYGIGQAPLGARPA